MSTRSRAEEARQVARSIGDMLYEKQLAYGDAGSMNLKIWQARMEQYLVRPDVLRESLVIAEGCVRGDMQSPVPSRHGSGDRLAILRRADELHKTGERAYLIPESLLAHIGRLTRVDDRIARIVSNPAGDRMGEDPWRDLAGDAIIGCIMPRTEPERQPVPGVRERMARAEDERLNEVYGDGPLPSATRIWNEGDPPILPPIQDNVQSEWFGGSDPIEDGRF